MLDIKVSVPDLAKIEREMLAETEADITGAMVEATEFLKDLLRDDVIGAGMGSRLAKTWRGETYPKGGTSLQPAGYVWSKAPEIIDAFSRGVTIRPVEGSNYLWIPTKNVPPRRRAGNYASTLGRRARGTRMSPEEVELAFNAELIIQKGKRGSLLALIDVVGARRGGGLRPATAGRLKGNKAVAPRAVKRVLMFVLVRQAKMPHRLNLQAAADRAGAYFVSLLS